MYNNYVGNGHLACAFAANAEGRCFTSLYSSTFATRSKMFSKGGSLIIAVGFLCAGFSAADDPVTPSPGSKRCPAVEGVSDTCVCHDGKGKIDLTTLSNADETPR